MPVSTPGFLDKAGFEFRPWVHKAVDTAENAKMPNMPDMPDINIPSMPDINMPNLPSLPARSRSTSAATQPERPPVPVIFEHPIQKEESFLKALLSGNLLNGCCARPNSITTIEDPSPGGSLDPADPTLAELEQARRKLEMVKLEYEKVQAAGATADAGSGSGGGTVTELTSVVAGTGAGQVGARGGRKAQLLSPPQMEMPTQYNDWDQTPPPSRGNAKQGMIGYSEDLGTPPTSSRTSRASSRVTDGIPPLPTLLEAQETAEDQEARKANAPASPLRSTTAGAARPPPPMALGS